jgi:5-methyltetrahydrofolate--homocysteine methyltransferase
MTAMGDVTEDDLYAAFTEQALALAAGGADALCIETMSGLDEACANIIGGCCGTTPAHIAALKQAVEALVR